MRWDQPKRGDRHKKPRAALGQHSLEKPINPSIRSPPRLFFLPPPFHATQTMAPRRLKTDDDPLTRAIAPPPNESPAERELRVAAEQEAKRVSDAIDDELNRQRIADKKSPKPIKILLLGTLPTPLTLPGSINVPPSLAGQSESGTSALYGLVIPI